MMYSTGVHKTLVNNKYDVICKNSCNNTTSTPRPNKRTYSMANNNKENLADARTPCRKVLRLDECATTPKTQHRIAPSSRTVQPLYASHEMLDAHYLSIAIVNNISAITTTYLVPPAEVEPERPTLVLDLDKTLIKATANTQEKNQTGLKAHLKIALKRKDVTTHLWIYLRPFLKEFLDEAAKVFNLIFWTAGKECYGKAVQALFDPTDKYFDHHFYYHHCTSVKIYKDPRIKAFMKAHGVSDLNAEKEFLFKPLQRIGRKHVFILDDAPLVYGYNWDRVLPIKPYECDPKDRVLLDLIPLIQSFGKMSNEAISNYIKEKHGISKYVGICRAEFNRTVARMNDADARAAAIQAANRAATNQASADLVAKARNYFLNKCNTTK